MAVMVHKLSIRVLLPREGRVVSLTLTCSFRLTLQLVVYQAAKAIPLDPHPSGKRRRV